MAHGSKLDEIFKSDIEKCTSPSTFMAAFTFRAPTSSRFLRPVPIVLPAEIENESDSIDSVCNKNSREKRMEAEILELQTATKTFARSLDYRTRLLANELPKFDRTVSVISLSWLSGSNRK